MEITKKLGAVLSVLVLALALVGCSDGAGLDDEGGIGSSDDVAASGPRDGGFEGNDGLEGDRRDRSGEAAIGGFGIEGPGDEEISIPEAEADPAELENYAESVRPVLDEGTRDFASLVEAEAGFEGDTASLGLSTESVEDALEANEDAYAELENLETPAGLGDVRDALLDSRERAISAYDNIDQAFANDAGADGIADAVEESLPEIEYANAEARAILQELERAGSSS